MSFNYENIIIVIIIFGIGFIISNTIGINIIEGHGEDTIQNICNTPESKLCYGINDGSCNMNTRKQLNYVLDEKSKNSNNLYNSTDDTLYLGGVINITTFNLLLSPYSNLEFNLIVFLYFFTHS